MMIYMSIQLSAINILIIPLLLVVTITISKILKKIFNRSKEYRTVLNTFLAESIYGIKLIKILTKKKLNLLRNIKLLKIMFLLIELLRKLIKY